ncbi:hypothetical protein L3049_10715 [Labilibaculum sp. DW002]|uniref:Uncharacterized protein n=1 Tax=Paralabilibaculum antarcticum TaxID=2912572 RepID=A0ABT5VST5_9BACT|nr:hypothetical protein [Labilibaculum sp. DW002]MDE5418481.1 hypothetical protein [Labilibaculum sp. DW002]
MGKLKDKLATITKEDVEFAKDCFNDGKGAINDINQLANTWNESKRLDNENLKIKGDIMNMALKFQQTQYTLDNIFSERRAVINKHFEVIDKGLKDGNDELLLQGLRSVSDFVSNNPLENFDKFCEVLDNEDETLELDF